MRWEKVKLGEVCDFIYGKSLKKENRNENGSYPVYGSSGVVGFHDECLSEEPTIVVGRKGSIGTVFYSESPCWTIDTAYYLKPKKEFNLRFLYYQLRTLRLDELDKSAAIPGLNRSDAYEKKIIVPPLPIQKQIANTLDKADALRKKDQELLQKYDELTQSIFYEMFGDPAHNDKNWEVKQLRDLVSFEKYALKRGPFGGALKKEIFKPSGYLVYEQYHAINDKYDLARYFIDAEKFKELEAFEVRAGDLIVSCSGVTLGRISELPKNALPGIINQALLKIKLDQTRMRNHFFVFQFRGEFIQSKLFGFSRGSGIPNFPPMDEIKSLEFVVPPVKMQETFCEVYRNIQEQKSKVSEAASDQFFNTLLSKSFN
jgi:type I restriction enzyme, S subunit